MLAHPIDAESGPNPNSSLSLRRVHRFTQTLRAQQQTLKILPAAVAANRNRMDRFIREAKSAAALNHPNIAHIYEIGSSPTGREGSKPSSTTAEVNFIAMEYIEGATLREKIHREHVELRKLLRYLQQVAEGLAKAHAAGIVHRDLKPDNVMIARDGYAKILDFGLAKLTEQSKPQGNDTAPEEAPTAVLGQPLSTPGLVMGTVGYMSPEQAQGKPVDHRSDIFSFGCLLYETATGQRAFESESTIDTLHRIVHATAPLVKDANPSAPADLTRIVRRCLAKDPDDRYQSIKEAAIELRELRRDLQGAEELDTTVPPSSVGSTIGSETGLGAAATTAAVSTAPASSAEYIVTRIKEHKVAAVIVLAAVLLAGVGLTAYLHARNTEVAIDSIAVLPFENKTADPDTDYLSEGLAESLIYRLSQLPNLKVCPTSSVLRYKGKEIDPLKAGQELGVSALLSGRILQRGDNLTISAELIDVRNNKLIWGEQYDRKMSELLATQREIAREIADRLRLKVSGQEKGLAKHYTESNDAYQLYMKGRFYWSKRTGESLKKAINEFQQSVDKDPSYALAYAGLADCYALLEEYAGTPSSETLPKARDAAQRALQLDDSLAEAHTSAAYVDVLSWQFAEAEREYKRAIELNPNYATGHQWYSAYLRMAGRLNESMAEIKRAQQADPLSPIIGVNVGNLDILLRDDLNAAVEEYGKVIEIDPNFSVARGYRGLAYVRQGRKQEAVAELQKAVELSGKASEQLSFMGYGYGALEMRAEAMAVLQELEQRYARRESPALYVAAVYAGLGKKDEAFAWLEKDFQARTGMLVFVAFYPNYYSLRDDSRYTDLLRRIGLRHYANL